MNQTNNQPSPNKPEGHRDLLGEWQNTTKRRVALYWPDTPEWRDFYPRQTGCEELSKLVRENAIATVYYRGLADEQILNAIFAGNPEARVVVWDYWNYWTHSQYSDDAQQTDKVDLNGEDESRWDRKRVRFQLEGSPHLFPDLFILDTRHGTVGITQARFVILAGEARADKDAKRYQWLETESFSVGRKIRNTSKGRAEANANWAMCFEEG